MTDVVLSTPPIEACGDAAARLVAEAFAPPTVEMDAPFLRWVLASETREGSAEKPFTVMGHLDGVAISFVGSPTRIFRVGDTAIPVTIPSWLAISPTAAGRGMARTTYGRLIDDIRERGLAVLTYAIEGARSVAFIESMYLERGFVGGILPQMPLFGAIRPPAIPAEENVWSPTQPVLTLDRTPAVHAELLRDPRGALDLGVGGAIAVTAWQKTENGRKPVLLLEHLPEPLTARSLAEAVGTALTLGASHGRQLFVPNLPEGARELGRLAGLRQLPGTMYRAWIWVPDPSHPAMQCTQTTHPIL
ncbi:MAG: hypothetical protein ABIR59_06445 [Gemmatimonadales bacterium]